MTNSILNDEEMKIMQEVKNNEKMISVSGVETMIQTLMNSPNLFNQFNGTIMDVVKLYPQVLNDFVNKYIAFKKNPTNVVLKNDFFNVLQKIKGIDSLVSQITMNIEKETSHLNTLLNGINSVLDIEKKDKQMLTKELDIVSKEIYGSHEMIGNFVDDYKRQRLENIVLMVGTIYVLFYVLYYLYKRWRP
jgi:hypothetical protein